MLPEALARLIHSLTNHPTSDPQLIRAMETIRDQAKLLGEAIIYGAPESRERSLAITNLEQTVMWAVKAIAVNQETTG